MTKNYKRKKARRQKAEAAEKVEKPKPLPIESKRGEILKAVKENQVVIVIGSTGCGKSTQIPQMLYEENYAADGLIACTQPRRIATWSLARRVAAEMGCPLGTLVGYKCRFEDEWDSTTKILYVTDGSLVRACPNNLKLYSVVVLDEVHQRSLQTDILFGLLKKALKMRKDLRVILSSATVNAAELSKYFNDAPVIEVEGTLYDVTTRYEPVQRKDYLSQVASVIKRIAWKEDKGDILAFLPGKYEIELVDFYLRFEWQLFVVHAHAELSERDLRKIHLTAPEGMRKVVLSTNMAETSLTIEGIVYIVDSGLVKLIEHDGRTGVNHLKKVWCSRAEADQRKGRAGRTQRGYCYRLYSEEVFNEEMPDIAPPEVSRLDLSWMVLQLKAMGYHRVHTFDFLDSPNMVNLKAAHDTLHRLNALNDKCRLTKHGRQMSIFPLEPKLAAALLTSTRLKCAEEVLKICAVMSAITGTNAFKLSPLIREKKLFKDPIYPGIGDFISSESETVALGEIFNEYVGYFNLEIIRKCWCEREGLNDHKMMEAVWTYFELKDTLRRLYMPANSSTYDNDLIAKCFLEGAFCNLAESKNGKSFYMTKDKAETKVQHPLLKSQHDSQLVFGLDCLQMGNSSHRVLTCVTRLDPAVDVTRYKERLNVCCKHVDWPQAKEDKENEKQKIVIKRQKGGVVKSENASTAKPVCGSPIKAVTTPDSNIFSLYRIL